MLELPADIFDAMLAHARAAAPQECCGLLVGRVGVATRCIPLRNELASPVAYRADARDLFHAFRSMYADRLDLVAIYHSHPTSPAVPSRVDLAENYYGELPRIIISLASEPPVVRAFRLYAGGFQELSCQRTEPTSSSCVAHSACGQAQPAESPPTTAGNPSGASLQTGRGSWPVA